ncbi:MAG: hypothetical protein JNK96_12880 [Betaproteobacteria bacterium]|nr:hypothetical protein [Betaproteobacteria bacterium]
MEFTNFQEGNAMNSATEVAGFGKRCGLISLLLLGSVGAQAAPLFFDPFTLPDSAAESLGTSIVTTGYQDLDGAGAGVAERRITAASNLGSGGTTQIAVTGAAAPANRLMTDSTSLGGGVTSAGYRFLGLGLVTGLVTFDVADVQGTVRVALEALGTDFNGTGVDLSILEISAPGSVAMGFTGDFDIGFQLGFFLDSNERLEISNLRVVPSPGTLTLLGIGLLCLVTRRGSRPVIQSIA